jgi:hypothetical protein
MLPAAFVAAVGVGIDVITSLASRSMSLVQSLEIARGAATAQGAYFKFAAEIRRARADVSFARISELYRAAQYYADPKKYLQQYDKDVIIDRRLASVVESPTGLAPKGGKIRYGVTVSVTFSGTGDTETFPIWVESKEYLAPEDVHARAIEEIMRQFKVTSRFQEYGGDAPNGWVTAAIDKFQRFVQIGVA